MGRASLEDLTDAMSADGRFAPTPSGPLHLGSLRTALVAWLFARSAGARFVVRIEDLDVAATRAEYVASHLHDLAALGLDWDPPLMRQSERFDAYRSVIDTLVARGLTYPCYCSRREVREAASAPHQHLPDGAYPGTCRELTASQRAERETSGRPASLRVRTGEVEVAFRDRVHGEVRGRVDDFVIRRNDGTPAYNLAVVVDDDHQRIGEVVRGADLLEGTPRHIHLAQLLDLAVPTYAHVPLVLGADGERLAKRHGSVTLEDRAALGQTPDEVRSLLAAGLGLAEVGEQVGIEVLLARFDPATLPTGPWVLPA